MFRSLAFYLSEMSKAEKLTTQMLKAKTAEAKVLTV
jgi:hypothetical protein